MKKFVVLMVTVLCGAPMAYATGTVTNTLPLHSSRPVPPSPAPAGTEHPKWTAQVTPYFWATGLKGQISPFRQGTTIRVKKSFPDVLDDLDLAVFLNVRVRYDRLVFSGDLMYVNTHDMKGTGPLPAMQLPGLGLPLPAGTEATAKVRTKQFMSTLLGGYRLIDRPAFTLDALGGVRFWHISNTVTVDASAPSLGRLGASHRESFHWVDPTIGMRTFLPITDKLSFQAQADIGGFGAGSDMSWSVQATLNYTFTNRLFASAGYKTLKVDYDHGGNVYNTRLSGPILGLTYRF